MFDLLFMDLESEIDVAGSQVIDHIESWDKLDVMMNTGRILCKLRITSGKQLLWICPKRKDETEIIWYWFLGLLGTNRPLVRDLRIFVKQENTNLLHQMGISGYSLLVT